MRLDPSIDLTDMLGQILVEQGRKSEAIAVLSSRPEGQPYQLLQKARHLADAGAFFRAQWMMDKAAAKQNFVPDNTLQGRIAEGTGKVQQAREAYQKGRASWTDADLLPRLFRLALAGGDAGAADRAYQELRDRGFNADPLARWRLALQLEFPRTRWRARDFAGIAALLGAVLGFLLLPLIALLPLHTFLLWRRLRRPAPEPVEEPGAWWFRHVYLSGGLMLALQFLGLYVFAYDELAVLLTPLRHSDASAPDIARFGLFYAVAQAAALGLMLLPRARRLRQLGPGSWTLRKCAGQVLITLVLSYAVGGLSVWVFPKPAAFSVDSLIRSLVQTYGTFVALVAAAVLIPIGEELIFRSILLGVLSRHLRFWLANLIQAVLFAAMHADPLRFVFYTVFGLLAGRLRRASGGLLASILYHGANNAVAVLVLSSALGNANLRKQTPAQTPGPELLACARLKAASKGEITLNNYAWRIAIDPAASRACLHEAEDAMDSTLRRFPEVPGYLDTKATVLFRQGRFDEAIDLERAAAQRGPKPFFFSQIDRFLRARQAAGGPVVIGTASDAVTFSLDPDGKALLVGLRAPLDEGFVLFARQARAAALLQLAAGPRHERSYRIPLPPSKAPAAPFDLGLLDARGCDDCQPGAWRSDLAPHDSTVDPYP
jgi:membrane protease YdiL (CAAX protease family)